MSVTIREQIENHELEYLSPYAMPSARSAGRKSASDKCPLRTEFQKDRDKITHCKAFRRLMHKTQVFISPEGDHYRTRLTHTLEVMQVARTIARALRLNEDLTEAIALGHDLGHTPFGHTGEDAMDALSPWGFQHNEQSVRVVEALERGGSGLNLTIEVLDGILNHPTRCMPKTLEGQTVRISDKIAYINHDIDDAIRAGILTEEDLPRDCTEILGTPGSSRIDFLIRDIIDASLGENEIRLHKAAGEAMSRLRGFLYKNVYNHGLHTNERKKIQRMLTDLYEYYMMNTDKLPSEFAAMINAGTDERRVVIDFVAGMTDRYALKVYTNIFVPLTWNV